MSRKIVTNHFVDMSAARRFYRPYYAHASSQAFNWVLRNKIQDGEIIVGSPPELEDKQTTIIEEGRYFIVDGIDGPKYASCMPNNRGI